MGNIVPAVLSLEQALREAKHEEISLGPVTLAGATPCSNTLELPHLWSRRRNIFEGAALA